MAETVFIFGAGASAHAGAPLMSTFYRLISDIQKQGTLERYQKEFDLIVDANNRLDNVYAKMDMGYHNNIEELLATFEMAQVLGRLGTLSRDQLQELPRAMKIVIAATIEESIEFDYETTRGIEAPHGYSNFADMLKEISGIQEDDFALITFNYDYGLDFALDSYDIPLDYFISAKGGGSGVPLLKLHGSLNWGVCSECSEIVPVTISEWKKTEIPPGLDQSIGTSGVLNLQISEFLPTVKHEPCDAYLEDVPYIVPPTWNKTQYQQQIAGVWQEALHQLGEARNIFIIGYSLPETDQFFRHLFALSLAGGPLINTLTIVNTNSDVYSRFSNMVGPKLIDVLAPLPTPFEKSRAEIRTALSAQGI